MNINVHDYLYHGITDFDYIKTLDSILSSGYIYTRDSLKKYLNNFEYQKFEDRHCANWNGKDAISIACHPNDTQFIHKYNLKQNSSESAYEEFIYDANISLVLNKSLLNSFQIKQKSFKMNYELQVIGDIPIEYIVAIATHDSDKSYSSKNLYILKRILLELNHGNMAKYSIKYSDFKYLLQNFENIEEIFHKKICSLYELQNLLNAYKLNIPIIDLKYGYVLPDLDKQKQKILEIKKQYLNIKRN